MTRATEPAYPVEEVHGDGIQQVKHHLGLTVREVAAIAAMQGIISAPDTKDSSFADVAHRAVRQADILLAELTETESHS